MGGGNFPREPPDKDQEPLLPTVLTVDAAVAVSPETLFGARLVDAPILLLIYFHKALRAEIAEIRHAAVKAAESQSHSRDSVEELLRRFEFLKLVYKYHCAAEDEVVFLALDIHVKNVACSYSLEHQSIDDLFSSIFHLLNVLAGKDENTSKPFQELIFSIGTIQSSICQHMQKEEQEVFPLLLQQFSSKEQASLVWQFICSVPVILLEDFFPWMISFLPPDEHMSVVHCIEQVVPKEKYLQEVVVSWLGKTRKSSFMPFTKIDKGVQCPDKSANMKNKVQLYSLKRHSEQYWHLKEDYFLHTDVRDYPLGGLHLWHGAIMKDLRKILEEISQMKHASSFSDLDLVVVRLKFLFDVLIFYSHALEKFFYPMLIEINGHQFSFTRRFSIENHIGSLQQLLHHDVQNGLLTSKCVEKLCWELQAFEVDISIYFAVQETEVFPIISRNYSHEMQQQLLYTSLHVLPLGLLKCVITWFSSHLSEDESQSILSTSDGNCSINKYFASLLLEWFRIGYLGKTSIENFGKNLQKIFKSRSSFFSEQIKEAAGSSALKSVMQLCRGSNPRLLEHATTEKAKKCFSYPSCSGSSTNNWETCYYSGVNLHIFFPETIRLPQSFPLFFREKGPTDPLLTGPVPIDLIFFFHKALKKDLDYLVSGSVRLAEDIGFLMEFCQRFHLVRFLYQIHSDAEDEIAFPALEAKGKLQNMTQVYTIDHKLKVEHLSKISLILHEMSELNISVPTVSLDMAEQGNMKNRQLCMNLQDLCKSLHKLLSDHIYHEELELWSLLKECFSIEEQEKIVGCMLGRMGAEILRDMIPWLLASLTPKEQHSVMFLWRQTTKRTMFDEWLSEWWEGNTITKSAEDSNISRSCCEDPLEIISTYLSNKNDEPRGNFCDEDINFPDTSASVEPSEMFSVDDKSEGYSGEQKYSKCSEYTMPSTENDKTKSCEVADVTHISSENQNFKLTQKSIQYEDLLTISQEDLEAAIRRVSRDSSLDPRKKSYIMQNLLMSRWIIRERSEENISSNGEDISGRHASYQDPVKLTFGCKHYKRNCKLFTPCCNQLFTCIRCHDEAADHSVDRKSITRMMCMKCLTIQPIGPTCSSVSCENFSMGKYYCKICKLFDDRREIYHCPFCNLCRVGKGLGIDYFHCMKCNACMSRSLYVHICVEKSLEDNCPICHEYIFTSSSPVKALPCGHLMHSTCFKVYTCTHYTCPICSKSLGDMQVYFRMLDALLADEKIPDEYAGQTQVILCNDCEKKGQSPFHWLYHKCSCCGSYNTRLL